MWAHGGVPEFVADQRALGRRGPSAPLPLQPPRQHPLPATPRRCAATTPTSGVPDGLPRRTAVDNMVLRRGRRAAPRTPAAQRAAVAEFDTIPPVTSSSGAGRGRRLPSWLPADLHPGPSSRPWGFNAGAPSGPVTTQQGACFPLTSTCRRYGTGARRLPLTSTGAPMQPRPHRHRPRLRSSRAPPSAGSARRGAPRLRPAMRRVPGQPRPNDRGGLIDCGRRLPHPLEPAAPSASRSSRRRGSRTISSPATDGVGNASDGQFDSWRPRLPGHPRGVLLAGVLRRDPAAAGLDNDFPAADYATAKLRGITPATNGVYVTVCRPRDGDARGRPRQRRQRRRVDCADRDCVAVPGCCTSAGAEVCKRAAATTHTAAATRLRHLTTPAAATRALAARRREAQATPAACAATAATTACNGFEDCDDFSMLAHLHYDPRPCCTMPRRTPSPIPTASDNGEQQLRSRLRRLLVRRRPANRSAVDAGNFGQPTRRRAATASATTATASGLRRLGLLVNSGRQQQRVPGPACARAASEAELE